MTKKHLWGLILCRTNVSGWRKILKVYFSSWLLCLVFYDKYDVEAGTIAVRDEVSYFQCPLRTYSYKLQLMNGGMTQFRFHCIEIQEIEDETDEGFKETK